MYQVTGVPPNSAGRIRPTANRDQNQEIQFEYDYDPTGNRLTSTENGEQSTYVPNNLNQYDLVDGVDYDYDLNGNLTDDGTNQYEYDYENRLVSGTGGQGTVTFKYDPLGRRSTKSDVRGTTLFIHDQDHVIQDYDCNQNLQSCTLSRSYLYSNRIDELLQVTSHTAQVTSYYVHHDALGSTIAITDKDAQLIETYQYGPYGDPRFFDDQGNQIPESSIQNRYLFTGREWDQESKTYHFRARTESPFLGRFLQRDPLTWGPDDRRLFGFLNLDNAAIQVTVTSFFDGKRRNINLISDFLGSNIINTGNMNPELRFAYPYTANNPINITDPYGESIIDWLIKKMILDRASSEFVKRVFGERELSEEAFVENVPREIAAQAIVNNPGGDEDGDGIPNGQDSRPFNVDPSIGPVKGAPVCLFNVG